MKCDHCDADVPVGVFCTNCGAHRGDSEELASAADDRLHSFAVRPGEHVFSPVLFTTLLPHLGRHRAHAFRWAFIGGLAGVFLFYLFGLISAALLVSAFLVPVLYLMYVYDAEVYRDRPLPVLLLTFGAGALLGIVVTVLGARLLSPVPQPARIPDVREATVEIGLLAGTGILLPIIQEVVKPLPALLLKGRGFNFTIDGLVFGVATGVGFSLTESLVNFADVLGTLGIQSPTENWLPTLTTVSVLSPLMQGSATGLVVAALWRLDRGFGPAQAAWLATAGLGHVAFWLGSGILDQLGFGAVTSLIWQAVVVMVMLLMVRAALHRSLLAERVEQGLAPQLCPDCHKVVMAANFCPACGRALHPLRSAPVAASTGPGGDPGAQSTAGEASL